MKVIHKVQQKSPEWNELRIKHPLTASEAQAIGNQGKGLETLCRNKLAEKYSSAEKDGYTNNNIDRGVELEPQAREIYELETGNKVEVVGFVTDDEISPLGGASPDSLVNEDGLLEIKCLMDRKHFDCIIEGVEVEPAYQWQMQMQMLFTGRKWCDYALYNPNYKKPLLIKRVYADPVMQEKIRVGLKIGEKIINEIENKIQWN